MTAPTSDVVWLSLTVFLLPFLSFLIAFLFPVRYSWLAPMCSSLLMLLATIASVLLFLALSHRVTHDFQFPWFSSGSFSVELSFHLTGATTLVAAVVCVISFLVHLYSIGYMAGEPDVRRYFALLGLFTSSMMGLVLTGDLLVLFVFWELVGFTSYLLIGFWRERPAAASAATKAFLMNRVGDIAFLTGILLSWIESGTLSIEQLSLSNTATSLASPTVGLCIFLGVMAKSAQFPFFSWLPDAMEGPTPVSALIHAATMVAAGIFLIGRVYFMFTPGVLLIMAFIGAMTAVLAATMALVHTDIKRILAYSTISQLGWMVMGLGAGDPAASQLHLITHAFFKACLFLSAGAVIHVLDQASHEKGAVLATQDIRHLGGLSTKMPFLFFAFLLSSGSLAGIPFFSGFLSKDAVLESIHSPFFLVTGLAIEFLTAVYTFRLLWYIFLSPPGSVQQVIALPLPSSPWIMRIPILILALGSTWLVVSWNPFHHDGWLSNTLGVGIERGSTIPVVSAGTITIALIFSFLFYRSKPHPTAPAQAGLIGANVGIDRWFEAVVTKPVLFLSATAAQLDAKWIDGLLHAGASIQVTLAHLTAWSDRTIIDGLANGSAVVVRTLGNTIRYLVNGKIQSYILWALCGLIIFMAWILFN